MAVILVLDVLKINLKVISFPQETVLMSDKVIVFESDFNKMFLFNCHLFFGCI